MSFTEIKQDCGFYSPKYIVSELDRYIVGQKDAKEAVAISLVNRERRKKVPSDLRDEIMPRNILMEGPTGVGKTEIARRLAKIIDAPFIKVDATKYTEVGYVGKDVESIIRDLFDITIKKTREKMRHNFHKRATSDAKSQIVKILMNGSSGRDETVVKLRESLESGDLDEKMIEIEVETPQSSPFSNIDMPNGGSAFISSFPVGDGLGGIFGRNKKKKTVKIKEAIEILANDIADDLMNEDEIAQIATQDVEENGIVFIDEIDKISFSDNRKGGEVSREGVQRDLLPLIEGTTVSTKYGFIKTDFILFIASGAFYNTKPSDLSPELQGRLPIRVKLSSLTKNDIIKILTEPQSNLIRQYIALLATENVSIEFLPCAIEFIADCVIFLNQEVENIGARRLYPVLEKVLWELNFSSEQFVGQHIKIDKDYVEKKLAQMMKNKPDLQKFIL